MPFSASRSLRLLLWLVIVAALAVSGYGAWYVHTPVPASSLPLEFEVPAGRGLRATARVLGPAPAGWVYGAWYVHPPVPASSLPLEFEVPAGRGLRATARLLEQAGLE